MDELQRTEMQLAIVKIRLLLNDASQQLIDLQISLQHTEIIRTENKNDL